MSSFTESTVEEAALAWLESIGWAVRNGAEIADWGFYLDLYQHFLNRVTWGREVKQLWYSMVNKMNAEIVSKRERVRRLGLMRRRMESLYQEMLGFLRLQRQLCAEQGMPVHGLLNLRKLLADLAESIQKVREMEASGIYQETPDIFGRYI